MKDPDPVKALFRENRQEVWFLLTNLVEGLGPIDPHSQRFRTESHLPQAEWLLDIDNARQLQVALRGLALERPPGDEPYFAPEKVQYYDGNPPHSTMLARRLVDRLQHGLSMVSHNNQEGGMGTTYDDEDVARRVQEIRLVVEDIAFALLGERAKDLVNFDFPAFGDVEYQREVPVCIEAEGPAAVARFKDQSEEC